MTTGWTVTNTGGSWNEFISEGLDASVLNHAGTMRMEFSARMKTLAVTCTRGKSTLKEGMEKRTEALDEGETKVFT